MEETTGALLCSAYSRPNTEKIDEYCDGEDKIEVYHYAAGQLTRKRISGACQGTGCNLFFESGSTTNNSITFSVNKAPFQYAFSDFAWNTGYYTSETKQVTISDLEPGGYTIYIREPSVNSCKAFQEFTILDSDTYGLKWFFEYYDINKVLTRVEILGKGFEGIATDIEYIDSNPVNFEWKGRGADKLRPIVPSECQIGVVAKDDFEYSSLFSSDEKAHRVDVYKGGDLFWTGFVVPDVYTEPYLSPPYKMFVSAIDGIHSLKDVEYDNINEFSTYIKVISDCLLKTTLQLQIEESCFINPHGETGSPLQNISVKNIAYKGLNCYEVLERVLFANLSTLFQFNGKWHILPRTVLTGEFNKRVFSPYGVYLSESLVNPITEIGNVHQEPFFIRRSQKLNISPAFKQVTVTNEFGLEDQILNNFLGELKDFYFYKTGTYRNENGEDEAYGITANTIAFGGSNSPSQTVDLIPTTNPSSLIIDVDYRVVKGGVFEAPHIEFTFTTGSYLEITIMINGNYKYYNQWGLVGERINSDFKTPNVNATEFYTWISSLIGSNYNITKNQNIVSITAKTASESLDFGNVTSEGFSKITNRNNRPLGFEDNGRVIFRVIAIDINGFEKGLTTNGHWLDKHQPREEFLLVHHFLMAPVDESGKWQSFSITSDRLPPNTEKIKVTLEGYGIYTRGIITPAGGVETHWKKVEAIYLPDGEYAPQRSTLTLKNKEKGLTFTPSPYTLYHGEAPKKEYGIVVNSENIYKNALYNNGELIEYFTTGTDESRLIDLVALNILNSSNQPTQSISGTMRGHIDFYNSFIDEFNPGKLFIINSMKYNDRKKEYELDLVEMKGYIYDDSLIHNALLLETGDYLLQEDGGLILLEDG